MLEVELLNISDRIQIRGTPGCGKTTLAKLLEAYISQKEPNAQVTYLRSWLSQADMPRKGWKEWLKLELESGIVLIVDEAQSSYWDKSFWLELKDINPDSACNVITLASYGSAGRNIYDPMTPFHISPQQSISLVAVDHGDRITVGLLLTKAEFDEVVPKLFQNHQFDVSFLDSVFDITRGHVGACEDFLRVVCAHEVSRSSWTNDVNRYSTRAVVSFTECYSQELHLRRLYHLRRHD